jgi:hypothetical protein
MTLTRPVSTYIKEIDCNLTPDDDDTEGIHKGPGISMTTNIANLGGVKSKHNVESRYSISTTSDDKVVTGLGKIKLLETKPADHISTMFTSLKKSSKNPISRKTTPISLNTQEVSMLFAGLSDYPVLLLSISPTKLTLNFNSLSSLPPKLTNSPSLLTTLELSNNNLTDFPLSVQESLTNLIVLNLAHNKLTDFPVAEYCLPKLQVLNISCNPIRVLPGYIGKMNLERLYLEWKAFSSSQSALQPSINNEQIASQQGFTSSELDAMFCDKTDLTCKQYLNRRVNRESLLKIYWMCYMALRLKSTVVLEAIVDLRPEVLTLVPENESKNIVFSAIEAGNVDFLRYVLAHHKNVFKTALETGCSDPVDFAIKAT